jgi:chemotaxis protein methyltransferase CheR
MAASNRPIDIIVEAIRDRLGIRLREQRLWHVVQQRQRALGLSDDAYATICASPDETAEWQFLIPRVTNQETFFFRDQRQLETIRHEVLPRIIRARRGLRQMQLWSAGCSTGAETYTLAILALEALAAAGESVNDWTVSVVGTDINEPALETARQGKYSEWALRGLDRQTRLRWFTAEADGTWHIKPALREHVHGCREKYGSEWTQDTRSR